MISMFPIASLVPCSIAQANGLLRQWDHKMGEVRRPFQSIGAWALLHDAEPVAVITAHPLVRETAAGVPWLTRETAVELSRLCAARSGLNRVMLRMWREFVFPALGYEYAISYQDADLHTGNTYRFDGWRRIAFSHSGGVDPRSGRIGRDKWVWAWSLSGDYPDSVKGAA